MGVKDSRLLKQYQTQMAKVSADLQAAKEEQRAISRRVTVLAGEVNDIARKISDLEKAPEDLLVSEHALLRYAERVKGVDMDEAVRAILTDKLREMWRALGNGTFPVNGFRAKIVDGVVVTVLA